MEHTPGIPKPSNERNSFINRWLGVWGMFQGSVGVFLDLCSASKRRSNFQSKGGTSNISRYLGDSQSIQGYWEAAGDVASRVGGAHGPIPGCFVGWIPGWRLKRRFDENGMHLKKKPLGFFKTRHWKDFKTWYWFLRNYKNQNPWQALSWSHKLSGSIAVTL